MRGLCTIHEKNESSNQISCNTAGIARMDSTDSYDNPAQHEPSDGFIYIQWR